MDSCIWVAAGYPVLVAGIVALWGAYQKSNDKLLKERHTSEQIWEALAAIVKKREETKRGGPNVQQNGSKDR